MRKTFFFLLLFSLRAFAADYISFSFNDAQIRDVLRAIARTAGVNIIIEKSVEGKITLSLKEVYYERALQLIAATNGYHVMKVDNVYTVGNLANFEDTQIRLYMTGWTDPEAMKKIVDKHAKTPGVIPLIVNHGATIEVLTTAEAGAKP
ncbi:MAG: hypothetical protein PHW04_18785 [Candidatus Wallbacteria bacterium]|nr:hypothetical protein [Candidatus Wallbacteria bacterium]